MMPAMSKDTHRQRRRPRERSLIRRGMLGLAVSAVVLSAAPGRAWADDDEPVHFDARVQGYTPNVEPKQTSTGMMWVLLLLLCAGTMGVMFMDAKRSHLD